jgi:inorganic pyrophosphatase/exopolyphosphatase
MSDNTNMTQTYNAPDGQTSDATQRTDSAAAHNEKVLTETQVSALLEKARSDEKSKVYGKVDELSKAKDVAEKQMKELEEKLMNSQKDLDTLKNGKATESELVSKELKELRENNLRLQKAIEETASIAATKIREFELKAYQEKAIRESGVKLVEFVSGSSEAEIDAAITKVAAREKQIVEEAKAEALKSFQATLPGPLAPNAASSAGPAATITAQNREAIASLKGSEYDKRRQQLLNEAMEKAGITG